MLELLMLTDNAFVNSSHVNVQQCFLRTGCIEIEWDKISQPKLLSKGAF